MVKRCIDSSRATMLGQIYSCVGLLHVVPCRYVYFISEMNWMPRMGSGGCAIGHSICLDIR